MLPLLRLSSGKVYWPRKSFAIREISSCTQKRISASSGTWTVKEKVSSHLGLKANEKRKYIVSKYHLLYLISELCLLSVVLTGKIFSFSLDFCANLNKWQDSNWLQWYRSHLLYGLWNKNCDKGVLKMKQTAYDLPTVCISSPSMDLSYIGYITVSVKHLRKLLLSLQKEQNGTVISRFRFSDQLKLSNVHSNFMFFPRFLFLQFWKWGRSWINFGGKVIMWLKAKYRRECRTEEVVFALFSIYTERKGM